MSRRPGGEVRCPSRSSSAPATSATRSSSGCWPTTGRSSVRPQSASDARAGPRRRCHCAGGRRHGPGRGARCAARRRRPARPRRPRRQRGVPVRRGSLGPVRRRPARAGGGVGSGGLAVGPLRGAFAFLSASARFFSEQGGDATVVQVHGRLGAPGDAGPRAVGCRRLRRARADPGGGARAPRAADPGLACWSSTPTIDRTGGDDAGSADPGSLADAVAYLASQSPRAMTHELQVTPAPRSLGALRCRVPPPVPGSAPARGIRFAA